MATPWDDCPYTKINANTFVRAHAYRVLLTSCVGINLGDIPWLIPPHSVGKPYTNSSPSSIVTLFQLPRDAGDGGQADRERPALLPQDRAPPQRQGTASQVGSITFNIFHKNCDCEDFADLVTTYTQYGV